VGFRREGRDERGPQHPVNQGYTGAKSFSPTREVARREKNSLNSRSRATVLEPLTIDMCRPTNRSHIQAPVSLAARSFTSRLAHPSRRKRHRLRRVGSVILADAAAWCWNRRHQGAATDRIASLTSAFGLAHVIYRLDRLGSEILLVFSCASSSLPFRLGLAS
jgi:hypothetical protein